MGKKNALKYKPQWFERVNENHVTNMLQERQLYLKRVPGKIGLPDCQLSLCFYFIFFHIFFFFLKRTFCCRQPYLPSAMAHTLSVERVSLWITSTSYLLLCLSLNSFWDEIQRTWTSVSPDTRGFSGVSVAKNLPANAGDSGSIPDQGRSHMMWSN